MRLEEVRCDVLTNFEFTLKAMFPEGYENDFDWLKIHILYKIHIFKNKIIKYSKFE